MKVSIIIPVYNEARTLPELLRRVRSAKLPKGCTREIILIDDGSVDETAALMDEIASDLTVLKFAKNRGKGAAVRSGLEVATGDVTLIQDADLEYDPTDYVPLLGPIIGGQACVVYGSRSLSTDARKIRVWNRLANVALTCIANALYRTRLSDISTGYKVFRIELLRSIKHQSERFDFCSEVTAKLLVMGHTIHEVSIRYNPRTIEEGKKIRAKDGLIALWTLLKLSPILRSASRDKVNAATHDTGACRDFSVSVDGFETVKARNFNEVG